jgi:alpha-mannosidase
MVGDPNKLLCETPGYNKAAQEVLARIRVKTFSFGGGSRAGVTVGSSPEAARPGEGINLLFVDFAGGDITGPQFKMLDDSLAWGPSVSRVTWQKNTWYWLRLRQTSSNSASGIEDRSGNAITAPLQVPLDISRDTFFVIPHSHWEGAVFLTHEEYLEMGLPIILDVLKLLQAYPHYRFVLDQVSFVRPFLKRYPEEQSTFRRLVSEGRLQLVGGLDIMPDVNMPSGESFIRQMLYGKAYYRENLGVEATVGWFLDTFGHHAQMPQLLKLGGYKSFWFARGVPDPRYPSEFMWQGLDGTRIPAYWLPRNYVLGYGSPTELPDFTRFFKGAFAALNANSRGGARVALAGGDIEAPEEHLPVLVKEFNLKSEAPFELRFGLPTDFERVVAERSDRPVISGEFNPVFPGAYSSRIELKQWTRNLEHLLTTAEKLQALGNWLGFPTEAVAVWRAWEPTLFNQAHDLMAATMNDHVYEDTVRGYDFSRRLAEELVATGLDRIAAQIDTQGQGIPCVVFNPLGWPRTDMAEVDVGFGDAGILDLKVLDSGDRAVPLQFLKEERFSGGGLKRVKIAFMAREVPGLGYAVYRLVPQRSPIEPKAQPDAQGDRAVIENELYRIAFNPWTGEMTSLRVKSGDWEALAGPANVATCEHDGGDLWELYQALNGGITIATMRQQPVPAPGKAQFSSAHAGQKGTVTRGPVYSEFSVSHPFTNGTFATTVRLYSGLRRIDIRTQILNNTKYVRYRALFPTAIKGGHRVDEIPFGAIARPSGIEFPAQNWIDYSNGEHGVALLNRGIPGNLVTDGTMMLSLLRSTRLVAYAVAGLTNNVLLPVEYRRPPARIPSMVSDSGFQLGKTITVHYSLVPHAGDWRQAGLFRDGLEFNNPLIVRKTTRHSGRLPKRWGWLEVSRPNVILTALKPGPDESTIVRVYEAAGQATSAVKLKFQSRIMAAYEANLMEDTGCELEVINDTLQFDLRAFEIKTFKLRLQSLGEGKSGRIQENARSRPHGSGRWFPIGASGQLGQ